MWLPSSVARLQNHQGPVRRLSISWSGWLPETFPESILRSPLLDKLQEFELYANSSFPLSVLGIIPVLRVLFISRVQSSVEIAGTFNFSSLKQLALTDAEISDTALHCILSRCPVLESLVLDRIQGCSRLQISSSTLRSLGVANGGKSGGRKLEELIIEHAPLLERLIPQISCYGLVIRVIKAPKLRTLGYLQDDIPTFEFGTMVFESMMPISMSNIMRSVKILALLTAPNLDLVTGLLRCFPCVEKLYIVSYTRMIYKNMQCYAPLECLDQHLKRLQITNYEEKRADVNFVKFFVLNARVLESVKLIVRTENCDAKWTARQHRKLQVNNRASHGARFEFEARKWSPSSAHMKHIHDLAMDPFDISSCRCHDVAFH
ncbi:hypothetical protein EJB05_13051 [Eragrostis curvula]|uniref:Uncharacterized protein n=1 Tax=Eragrostis curvula TaxID=38414 RepID=A0A5J9VWA1_9POAL|nr:hypothetical protein EJB05_13051 [Eragrostis curvula]